MKRLIPVLLAFALLSTACGILPIEPTPTPTYDGPSGMELHLDCDTQSQGVQEACTVASPPHVRAVIENHSAVTQTVYGIDFTFVTSSDETITAITPVDPAWVCFAGAQGPWGANEVQRGASCYNQSAGFYTLAPGAGVELFQVTLSSVPQEPIGVRYEAVDVVDGDLNTAWSCSPSFTAPVACFASVLLPVPTTPSPTITPTPTEQPSVTPTPVDTPILPTITLPTVVLPTVVLPTVTLPTVVVTITLP